MTRLVILGFSLSIVNKRVIDRLKNLCLIYPRVTLTQDIGINFRLSMTIASASTRFPLSQSGFDSLDSGVSYFPLSEGVAGTFESLDAMAQCVRGDCPPDFSGFQDEFNRQAAERLVAEVPSQDVRGEINAVFLFVRDQIPYRKHPFNQQRVQDCRRTLELGSGDCVSKSVCLATLLFALGYEARFVAQCPDGVEFSHVYVEARDDFGNWIALDPVAEDQPMGWSQSLPYGGFETTWQIF